MTMPKTLKESCHMNLQQRVDDCNHRFVCHLKPLTMKGIKKIYKNHKIKKKRVIKHAFNYNKYNDEVLREMLIKM